MVVVVLIASGAAVCLKLYMTAQSAGEGVLARILFNIKQQAGVLATLSSAVFSVLTALTTGKVASPSSTGVPANWGQRAGAPATSG